MVYILHLFYICTRTRDIYIYKKPSQMEGIIILHAWWESSSVVVILETKTVMRKIK